MWCIVMMEKMTDVIKKICAKPITMKVENTASVPVSSVSKLFLLLSDNAF